MGAFFSCLVGKFHILYPICEFLSNTLLRLFPSSYPPKDATLKKAAEKADNNSLSPTFLIQAGEILESQNKKDEALKLYQTVKDKYFNSMQYQNIDAYIERASAK